jgi:uncharacterized membrane protein HdeD (DUF308 family)
MSAIPAQRRTGPGAGRALRLPDVARVMIVRGVVAVVFGVLALVWPALTAVALALLFGAYALIDGVGLIIAAFRHGGWPRRLLSGLAGLLSFAAGAVAVVWPGITVLALAILVGAWALVTGISEIVAAIRLRQRIRGEAWLAVGGLISAVAGLFILFRPLAGAVGIAIVLGCYALVFGILLTVAGIRLRRANL